MKCALGLVIAITLTFIVIMIIFMGCFSSKQGESRPVYDALYIGGTFFGGFATLTAAYIASRMFNDWRDAHNKSVDKEIIFGVISNLNNFLLETQHFHNSISQVVNSSELIQFELSNDEFAGTIDYLRQIIRQHENAVVSVTNNYSDLESVMSEDRYEIFAADLQQVIKPLMDVHESFINDVNNMLNNPKTTPDVIEFYFKKFRKILDHVNTDENGVIVRIKAIKKELSKFYRA